MLENNMTKKAAIQLVNETLNLKLNSNNTIIAIIYDDKKWVVEFKQDKRIQKLYILLNNNLSKKMHVFELPANHLVYNLLYDKPFYKNIFRLMFNFEDDEFIELYIYFNFKKFLKWTINYE